MTCMIAILQWLHLLALATWLGETVFLSFVVAPTIFRTFPTDEAGRVMSALFPNYYRLGYGCGLVLLVSAAALWRLVDGGALRWGVTAGLAAAMLVACLYAGVVIQPRVLELRAELHRTDVPTSAKAEFDQLHRRAVQLNGAVLLGNLMIAGIVVSRLGAR